MGCDAVSSGNVTSLKNVILIFIAMRTPNCIFQIKNLMTVHRLVLLTVVCLVHSLGLYPAECHFQEHSYRVCGPLAETVSQVKIKEMQYDSKNNIKYGALKF
jgi:membrane protein YdbS with pleckstrin-like domain